MNGAPEKISASGWAWNKDAKPEIKEMADLRYLLKAEVDTNKKLREFLRGVLVALGNGADCAAEAVSMVFLSQVQDEVKAVVDDLRKRAEVAEIERDMARRIVCESYHSPEGEAEKRGWTGLWHGAPGPEE